MLLTITARMTQATNLGYILAKNPARVQKFEVGFGTVHVFYPVREENVCTAAIQLEVNPIEMVKDRAPGQRFDSIDQYVNDRPYVASSLLSTSIAKVFKSALLGECKDKPELPAQPIPLSITLSAVVCRRPGFIEELFQPLGYMVTSRRLPNDPAFPSWGESWCYEVTLEAVTTVRQLLRHLYVLVPVLDNNKHYGIVSGDEEAAKLVKYASEWLPTHPSRRVIALRYLRYKEGLADKLLASFDEKLGVVNEVEPEEEETQHRSDDPEAKLSLHERRHAAVIDVLKDVGANSVIDLGCGSGKLVKALVAHEQFGRIVGIEPATRPLEIAGHKMRRLDEGQRARVELLQSSLTYRDDRLTGFDGAACVEVIEHLDPERLDSLEESVFGACRPRTVVVTTPNREYNVLFGMEPGQMRHDDHRFEFTRQEFNDWAQRIGRLWNYDVRFDGIGDADPEHGHPSQMAIFTRVSDDNLPQVSMLHLPAVDGDSTLSTWLVPEIRLREGHKRAALELTSRQTIDPRLLVYIPPTMSPCDTSSLPGTLEHPEEAFRYYQERGVKTVVMEEKHMGSRAVVLVCRNAEAMRRRFGVVNEALGVCYTRTGRRFFDDGADVEFMRRLRMELEESSDIFWDLLRTDWALLDCELMPWSAKAQGLLRKMYAPVGAAGEAALAATVQSLSTGVASGLPLDAQLATAQERLDCIQRYRQAYGRYCWDVSGLDDYRLAPFHILATEGKVHFDKTNYWHMSTMEQVVTRVRRTLGKSLLYPSEYRVVSLLEPEQMAAGIERWEELTGRGGEGMVVKPMDFLCEDASGKVVQPAVKVRGREYLRIIYSPEYTRPENLERLRKRNTSSKRSLAVKEFALGLEGLHAFVSGKPLAQVHQSVFATLALESEPVDPRL